MRTRRLIKGTLDRVWLMARTGRFDRVRRWRSETGKCEGGYNMLTTFHNIFSLSWSLSCCLYFRSPVE